MLLCIGTRLHAERVLLMEEDSTALHLTYDWAANDLTPLKGTLAPIPRSELAHIYEKFIHHPVITIRDLESYWEHTPGAVPHLPDLTRLTISRISLDDHAYGYIEVVNPPEDRLDVSSLLCSTLSRFIAILLRNRDMQNDLRHLGRIDQLTGVFNRRGLTEYLPTLPHGRLVALVFADVNGLKHTNDTQGHEAGDRLIKQTADALRQEPDAVVFRMGGDEFLLIRDVQTPEEIETIRQSLKQEFHRRGISAALGAITLPTPIEDIDAAIAEVDRLMYEDKTRHYRSRHEKRG
ncbi:GGDEF domain-containing protein [Selenomonas bovis]|uniref:GGDEF domain-containing protein n=1 Tax=Selenomonas bovis TaxID=416586 RepID=UPI000380AB88|nr:GGDEF domain-containing protein [Selenomonas bovis]